MKAKKWIMAKGFHGVPTEENVKLVEFELPDELNEGGMQSVNMTRDKKPAKLDILAHLSRNPAPSGLLER